MDKLKESIELIDLLLRNAVSQLTISDAGPNERVILTEAVDNLASALASVQQARFHGAQADLYEVGAALVSGLGVAEVVEHAVSELGIDPKKIGTQVGQHMLAEFKKHVAEFMEEFGHDEDDNKDSEDDEAEPRPWNVYAHDEELKLVAYPNAAEARKCLGSEYQRYKLVQVIDAVSAPNACRLAVEKFEMRNRQQTPLRWDVYAEAGKHHLREGYIAVPTGKEYDRDGWLKVADDVRAPDADRACEEILMKERDRNVEL